MPYSSVYGQTLCKIQINGQEIKARQVILPLPPSENKRLEVDIGAVRGFLGTYYSASKKTRRRGLMRNSTAYNQWKRAAETLLRKGKLPKIEGPVCVLLTVVFPDGRIRDAQNREKAVFDAMQDCTCLIENDVNVVFHTTERRIISGKSFLLAFVFPFGALENPFTVDEDYLQKIAGRITDA